MEIKNKDLGFLGIDYQFRLVSTFFNDQKFFTDIYTIVDQNMFTEPPLRTIVGIMKEYYEKGGIIPTKELITIEVNDKFSTKEKDREIIISTLEKIVNYGLDGSDIVKEKATKFFKQQNLIKVFNQVEGIIQKGNLDGYYAIEEMVQKALSNGNSDTLGVSVTHDLMGTLSEEYRMPITTGVLGVDKILEGGLGAGELGVIIGPSSFGKTSLTTCIAQSAALQGAKALQIVFEDKEKQIQRKHIARVTEVEARNLSKPEYKPIVLNRIHERKEEMDIIDNNLLIKKFPTGAIRVNDLKNYIRQLINTGFKPDVVIVDYFECLLASGRDKDQWVNEAKTMRELEQLSNEFQVALWVPTQGNRDSMGAEIVTMDKAGGAFAKIQIAHIIMSISRSMDDIKNNIAKIAILKNRAGGSGIVLEDVYFNNGTCIVRTQNDYNEIVNNTTIEQPTEEQVKFVVKSVMELKETNNDPEF